MAVGDSPDMEPVSVEHADELVRAQYGVYGSVHRLGGERDANFLVESGVQRFVLKVAPPGDDESVLDLQTSILSSLAEWSAVTPHTCLTKDGRPYGWVSLPSSGRRAFRLITYVSGTALKHLEASTLLSHRVGALIADLDVGLAALAQPRRQPALLWDLQQVALTKELSRALPGLDPLVESTLDRFERVVLAELLELPSQVVHNDPNPDNILVRRPVDDAGAVSAMWPTEDFAVIDFGDAVWAPRIVDLAVYASYLVPTCQGPDTFTGVIAAVTGYHSASTLRMDEIRMLYDLIMVRLATAVCVPTWRASMEPGNSAYLLRHTSRALGRLRALHSVDRTAFTRALQRGCQW